jgi:hypothetical protein
VTEQQFAKKRSNNFEGKKWNKIRESFFTRKKINKNAGSCGKFYEKGNS